MGNYLDSCLELSDWHTPATDYPETQVGNYRIKRGRYNRGHYYMYGIDGYIFFQAMKPLPVTMLQELKGKKWHQWMVDDPPHWRAMEIYAEQSEGNILCAGLGLGLILHALAKNDKVKRIVCVEISQDVIDLMSPNVASLSKVEIIKADFYQFVELDPHPEMWGGMIVDLWVASEKTKMGIYYHEVLPFAAHLGFKYQTTPITFHGFTTLSAIQHTSPEMKQKISEILRREGLSA